jgi:eukaryotic-like serine/threonine-protein kinase
LDFRSLFGKKKEEKAGEGAAPAPTVEPGPPAPARATDDDVEQLARAGQPNGPTLDEALLLFRALRRTPDEGRAIRAVVARSGPGGELEPLLVAAASAMVDRGESEAALGALSGATSSPALLLAADLLADKGEAAAALARTERVLLRDFDHPGARERHKRFGLALGLREEPKAPATAAVTVAAAVPDSPFRLLREVARGGAGAVYEAEDRELGRTVALKVYHHPERDRAQLTHEARVAAALAGPGVVRVFDVDPDHGWLALEWAPLGALRDPIRRRDAQALAPIEEWMLPLATALARTHAGGWVHHDVKPANVLLRRKGVPVLSDFGTARRIGEPSPPGSLGYVSPERLRGRPSDPRDDVYGLGRILEDVLDVLPGPLEGWRKIAAACTGPDEVRPTDARALVTRLRVEAR